MLVVQVGGAVSHQLYGEPSYHMNIRCVGVQYTRTNPERFIESIAGDSWARYLADVTTGYMG